MIRIEERILVQMFEVRYTDGFNVMSSQCTPDTLPDVLRHLMDEDKRILHVDSKWI